MHRHLLIFLAVATLALSQNVASAQSSSQKKWAVVIGINQYNQAPNLQYAVNDSNSLALAFQSLGFESIDLLNDEQTRDKLPTRENIEAALKRLLDNAEPSDLIVLVFSGHGVGLDGQSWICPMEANLEQPDTTLVSVEGIVNTLLECKASQKVLLFDACRNSTQFDNDSTRAVGVRATPEWKQATRNFVGKISPPQNQELALLSSCDDGQESYEDDDLKHGVFTYVLLEQLRGRSVDDQGFIEFSQLALDVRKATAEKVRARHGAAQSPVQSGYHGGIRLGKYLTLINEDFQNVEVGGLPAGPWRSDADVLVDTDPQKRKMLCAVGDGGWVYASDIQVSGEFELRCQLSYSREQYSQDSIWIAFDEDGETRSPAVICEWDSFNKEVKVWSGILSNLNRNSQRYQEKKWATRATPLKVKGTSPQLEIEIVIRRELVQRGREKQARYQIIVNGDDENPITVSGQAVTSFNQVGFWIGSNPGNSRLSGIHSIKLMPVIDR